MIKLIHFLGFGDDLKDESSPVNSFSLKFSEFLICQMDSTLSCPHRREFPEMTSQNFVEMA
jgi:hypothetical protein